jgi:hypothetical protein
MGERSRCALFMRSVPSMSVHPKRPDRPILSKGYECPFPVTLGRYEGIVRFVRSLASGQAITAHIGHKGRRGSRWDKWCKRNPVRHTLSPMNIYSPICPRLYHMSDMSIHSRA